ncbi:DUF5667 domain-containing protein [Streptomyces diastatochromogenes]|nr:DUF5667 domain-containing protein [Streptomyces diastatochromogenes]
MIANVSAHRRANAFAQALEDRASEDAAAEQPEAPAEPAEPAEQGRLLALANGLGELPKPQLDPEVKVVQRAQLVAAMEAMLMEGAPPGPYGAGAAELRGQGSPPGVPCGNCAPVPLDQGPRRRRPHGRRRGGRLRRRGRGQLRRPPGDSLYGLKRGMEDIKLGMADDDADRGGIYLDQASTRLSEARRLMERGRAGELDHESLAEIRRVLGGMKHDASEGRRLLREAYDRDGEIAPMARLNSFAQAHRDTWNGLRDRLPVQLADVGSEVTDVFDAIDEDVEPLQSVLPRTPERGVIGSEGPRSRPGTPQGTQGADTQHPPAATRPPLGQPPRLAAPLRAQHRSEPEHGRRHLLARGGRPPRRQHRRPPQALPTGMPTAPAEGQSTPEMPDVTLPPLLPGLLPGLGIDSEDAR